MNGTGKEATPIAVTVTKSETLIRVLAELGHHHVEQIERATRERGELLDHLSTAEELLEGKARELAHAHATIKACDQKIEELTAALERAKAVHAEHERQIANALATENRLLEKIREQADRLTSIHAVIRDARQEGPAKTPLGEAVDSHLEELSEVIVDLRSALS